MKGSFFPPEGPATYLYARHGETWYVIREEAQLHGRRCFVLASGPFLSQAAATLAIRDLEAIDRMTRPDPDPDATDLDEA